MKLVVFSIYATVHSIWNHANVTYLKVNILKDLILSSLHNSKVSLLCFEVFGYLTCLAWQNILMLLPVVDWRFDNISNLLDTWEQKAETFALLNGLLWWGWAGKWAQSSFWWSPSCVFVICCHSKSCSWRGLNKIDFAITDAHLLDPVLWFMGDNFASCNRLDL